MGEGPRRRFPAHPRPHPAFTERGVSLLQRVQGEGKGRCLLWSQDRAVALSGSTLHARCSTLETESHRVGVGREDLSPQTPNPPENPRHMVASVFAAYRPVDDELSGGSTTSAET